MSIYNLIKNEWCVEKMYDVTYVGLKKKKL